jgi:hypothetical protein
MEEVMKSTRKLWVLALAAVLIVSCSCVLFGPSLAESRRVGRYITVDYPEDWYVIADSEIDVFIFSPENLDPEDYNENLRSPIFMVMSLEDYVGSDWYEYYSDPEDVLEEMAWELDVGIRSIETQKIGDITWTKASISGPMFDSTRYFEGWAAVEVLSRGGTLVVAAAQEDDWEDYDNIFEAMLRAMEIRD